MKCFGETDKLFENSQKPVIEQIMPLLFAPGSSNYYTIGAEVGKTFSIGKGVKQK